MKILYTGLVLALSLTGCASWNRAKESMVETENVRKELSTLPTASLSDYTQSLANFGELLSAYKTGEPPVYIQSKEIADVTNLSSPLAGSEIPGDITEMLRSAINKIGDRVIYIPYYPDYIKNQVQLGSKFGITMPNYLITGAITEYDRGFSSGGAMNNASVTFGRGEGQVNAGDDFRKTILQSSLGIDLNLVNFSTQQMMPTIQSSNRIVILNLTKDYNASVGFYGQTFGFKTEGKVFEARHRALRTLVELSAIELLGRLLTVPYWRCIPGGKEDPVVKSNMKKVFVNLSARDRIAFLQIVLEKYKVSQLTISGVVDQATSQALQLIYQNNFNVRHPVNFDPTNWDFFWSLYVNIPFGEQQPTKSIPFTK